MSKKRLAIKKCEICQKTFQATKNDRPNSWNNRKFCSSKCCNSRTNKGTFKLGHAGFINSHSFVKGNIPWNIGIRFTQIEGENHPLWKGNDVGYSALHSWIKRKLGQPTECVVCGKKDLTQQKIHWANVSGRYLRDVKDWARMCAKRHRNYDLSNNLIRVYGKK